MIRLAVAAVMGGAVAVGAVPAALSMAGFTGAGIAASSLAAKMMSAAAVANGGGVGAGSLVATLQSVGGSWTLYIIQRPPGLHWVRFGGLAWKVKKGTTFLFLSWTQG